MQQTTNWPLTRCCVAAWSLCAAAVAHSQTLPLPPVSPVPVVNYEYDAEGNPTKTVVAPGSRNFATQIGYDALGRRTTSTNAKSGVTQFGYDLQDQLTSVKDPRQLTTQYQPTGLGDVAQLVSPDTGTANSTFDAAGNLATSSDARGVLATYSYDALNRVTQIAYSQLKGSTRTVKFTYDQTGSSFGYGVGHVTTLSSPDASIALRYDALGRVTSTAQNAAGRNLVVGYEYDSAGRITKVTYPSGRAYNYNRVNGLVQSITKTAGTDTAPLLGQIVMNALGRPESWTWTLASPQKPHARVYDTNGRLVRHPLGLLVRDITYDDADRISRYTHYTAANAQAAPTYDQSFGYDELDRLITVTGANNWSYGYDANGNRTASAAGAVAQGYTVAAASNRLDGLTNPVRTMKYDLAGNTSSDTQTGSAANYTAGYSLEGRLASMTLGTTDGVEFIYDALGRRVSRSQWTGARTNPRAVTIYAYDQQNHLIGEYAADGSPINEYIWLDDIPVAMIKASGATATTYAIHTDHLNTPRVLMDAAWNVRWRWMGEPFGANPAEEQPTGNLAAVQQNLRFPGQQYEAFGGRHYNHFRDYDPTTGRYIQSDPIGLDGGINTYAYANGNPLSFYDPYGLWGMDDVYGAIYNATGGWEPSQELVDFGGGFGDVLTFGFSKHLRSFLDINSVNRCSSWYTAGEISGVAASIATGYVGGTKMLARRLSPTGATNFSHSLFPSRALNAKGKFYEPWLDNSFGRWLVKGKNRLNGDYLPVSRNADLHARMDSFARRGLDADWLARNPAFGPFQQFLNRMPYTPGAAIYGALSFGSNQIGDCSCQ